MTGDIVPITDRQMGRAQALREIVDSALYLGYREKVKLPWWRWLLTGRRYKYVWHSPMVELLRRPDDWLAREYLTWQQVVIDRLVDQPVQED